MKNTLSLILVFVILLLSVSAANAADKPNDIPVLSMEDIPETPKGMHHYFLICIDAETDYIKNQIKKTGHMWDFHTDGMMLITLDESTQRVMVTTFNREILIQRPDGKFGRINNFLDHDGWAYAYDKTTLEAIQGLIDTINTHFALRIEKFIVVDFSQVQKILDTIGGIDITLTSKEKKRIESYGTTIQEKNSDGTYHLSGYQAVLYMRIRKNTATEKYMHEDGHVYSDNDTNGRTYRSRKVASTVAEKLKNISLGEATDLLDLILVNLWYTNMTTDDFINALYIAMQLRGVPVAHINMPVTNPSKQKDDGSWYEETPSLKDFNKGNRSYCSIGYAGMAVLQVNYDLNRKALWDFLLDSFVVVDEE